MVVDNAHRSGLNTLDLSSNSFTGTIPPWLGNMMGLYSLNLSNNALTSTIPIEIRNLQILGNLDLHSNYLKGPITAVFSMKSRSPEGNFEIVNLSHNNFMASIPLKAGKRIHGRRWVFSCHLGGMQDGHACKISDTRQRALKV